MIYFLSVFMRLTATMTYSLRIEMWYEDAVPAFLTGSRDRAQGILDRPEPRRGPPSHSILRNGQSCLVEGRRRLAKSCVNLVAHAAFSLRSVFSIGVTGSNASQRKIPQK
jgi:hypothetical protein